MGIPGRADSLTEAKERAIYSREIQAVSNHPIKQCGAENVGRGN